MHSLFLSLVRATATSLLCEGSLCFKTALSNCWESLLFQDLCLPSSDTHLPQQVWRGKLRNLCLDLVGYDFDCICALGQAFSELSELLHIISGWVKYSQRGRSCFSMLQPYQTWSLNSDAHMLDVLAFGSQISLPDGSTVTYTTPHPSYMVTGIYRPFSESTEWCHMISFPHLQRNRNQNTREGKQDYAIHIVAMKHCQRWVARQLMF